MVGDVAERALEREMEMVKSAIDMVAWRRAMRVTVGGLRFGEELLAVAQPMARAAGVQLVPVWTSDEHGADITVERRDDG